MTRPDLAEHARAELASRELHYPDRVQACVMSTDEAGRALAAWRAIAALLGEGSVVPEACLGEKLGDAWPHLLKAVGDAVEHRVLKDDQDDRLGALKQIRTLLIRSAARQGSAPQPEAQRKAA